MAIRELALPHAHGAAGGALMLPAHGRGSLLYRPPSSLGWATPRGQGPRLTHLQDWHPLQNVAQTRAGWVLGPEERMKEGGGGGLGERRAERAGQGGKGEVSEEGEERKEEGIEGGRWGQREGRKN